MPGGCPMRFGRVGVPCVSVGWVSHAFRSCVSVASGKAVTAVGLGAVGLQGEGRGHAPGANRLGDRGTP